MNFEEYTSTVEGLPGLIAYYSEAHLQDLSFQSEIAKDLLETMIKCYLGDVMQSKRDKMQFSTDAEFNIILVKKHAREYITTF